MKRAERIRTLPPYLFAELDKKKAELIGKGVDVISLGIGDPDMPSPSYVVEELQRASEDPATHQYPAYEGSRAFREAMADYYRRRFGVNLDPEKEVMTVIGSKEGIAHIIWGFVEADTYALIPDPGYPVYKIHTMLAGGTPYYMPLRPENGFLPDLDAIPADVAGKARIMFLNYPNNPTAAVADLDFFRRAVQFCRENDILLCHDNAYAETVFDGYIAPSVLQVEGAKDVAVEFYSLSKPFNMTGWRLGACVGNRDAVAALGIIKTNTDSGQFDAVQRAGIRALKEDPQAFIGKMNELYRRRRDLVVGALREVGIDVPAPKGTFYIWVPVPKGYDSQQFATFLLEETGVIVPPGSAYGPAGEGFVRISLTAPDDRLAEAMRRIKEKVSF